MDNTVVPFGDTRRSVGTDAVMPPQPSLFDRTVGRTRPCPSCGGRSETHVPCPCGHGHAMVGDPFHEVPVVHIPSVWTTPPDPFFEMLRKQEGLSTNPAKVGSFAVDIDADPEEYAFDGADLHTLDAHLVGVSVKCVGTESQSMVLTLIRPEQGWRSLHGKLKNSAFVDTKIERFGVSVYDGGDFVERYVAHKAEYCGFEMVADIDKFVMYRIHLKACVITQEFEEPAGEDFDDAA